MTTFSPTFHISFWLFNEQWNSGANLSCNNISKHYGYLIWIHINYWDSTYQHYFTNDNTHDNYCSVSLRRFLKTIILLLRDTKNEKRNKIKMNKKAWDIQYILQTLHHCLLFLAIQMRLSCRPFSTTNKMWKAIVYIRLAILQR